MQRRQFIYALGAIPWSSSALGAVPNHYAESVAMTGHSEDAATTFDVRIARFPEQNRGTLWMYAFVDGHPYSLVEEACTLPKPGVTEVSAADATFAVAGPAHAQLSGKNRHSTHMTAELTASGLTHNSAHPPLGIGDQQLTVTAQFTAAHKPINVRPGRIEVMGQVDAYIQTPKGNHTFTLPGKWHEQSGQRRNFAPAFTYLFVQGHGIGLMCTKHRQGAWGYVFQEGKVVSIKGMDIEAYGQSQRRFSATLSDGSSVDGSARVVREVSVPIEGQRRPGATVIVESSLGTMVGVLNDWNPN